MTQQDIPDELKIFLDIARVPRPSGHTDAIRKFLADFAESFGLAHSVDSVGNVVVRRAGEGTVVTLQAHMDMVPASVPGYEFDFENTPLDVSVDNGWVHADGTTLGADDGAGMAIALTALTSPELEGCAIECLFTVDEETGLDGARGLGKDSLEGRYLVNIDSEDVNEITVGCAGSTTLEAAVAHPLREPAGFTYRIEIAGLLGGHSAGDIDKGRTNAILTVVRFLSGIPSVRLGLLEGGDAPNSIPNHAAAVFCVPYDVNVYEVSEPFFDEFIESVSKEEPEAAVAFGRAHDIPCWSVEDTRSFLDTMTGLRNGVFSYGPSGVRSSSSLGTASTSDGCCRFTVMPRSSDAEELSGLISSFRSYLEGNGATVPESPVSPPWAEKEGCALVETAAEVYRTVFRRDPRICVTHGGLECGIIRNLNPSIEGAISVGPTILGAHSPSERMDVATLSQMREYVFGLVRKLSSRSNVL